MKTYLNITDLSSISESGELVRLIYGNLNIENGTHIYDQPSLFSGLLSSVEMRDSTISGISYSQSPIEVILSEFVFENMIIKEITTLSTYSFILATFSEATFSRIDYMNSNALLINILYSDVTLNNVNFTNIANSTEFIRIISANSADISQISFVNSSTTSKFLILIQRSKDIEISDINFTELPQIFVHIERSEVTSIESINVSNSRETFSISDSTISLLSNSTFINNRGNNKGGVISLSNSQMRITNSTFTNNTATIGGAISFE